MDLKGDHNKQTSAVPIPYYSILQKEEHKRNPKTINQWIQIKIIKGNIRKGKKENL